MKRREMAKSERKKLSMIVKKVRKKEKGKEELNTNFKIIFGKLRTDERNQKTSAEKRVGFLRNRSLGRAGFISVMRVINMFCVLLLRRRILESPLLCCILSLYKILFHERKCGNKTNYD
jgi:hypothetical protein